MKKKRFLLLFTVVSVLAVSSCSLFKKETKSSRHELLNDNVFHLTKLTTDKTYGYTEENPIKVGGVENSEGPKNERRFLNALSGPKGEAISYYREGSCCHFKTKKGFMGTGLLDIYIVTWKGNSEPVTLYINMYDYDELMAPVGFTIRK